jgi:hypothetical protein
MIVTQSCNHPHFHSHRLSVAARIAGVGSAAICGNLGRLVPASRVPVWHVQLTTPLLQTLVARSTAVAKAPARQVGRTAEAKVTCSCIVPWDPPSQLAPQALPPDIGQSGRIVRWTVWHGYTRACGK